MNLQEYVKRMGCVNTIQMTYNESIEYKVFYISCAKEGNLIIIKNIIKENNINVLFKTKPGLNALHFACIFNSNLEVIKFLIDSHVDIFQKTYNYNMFMLACHYNNNLNVIKFLEQFSKMK